MSYKRFEFPNPDTDSERSTWKGHESSHSSQNSQPPSVTSKKSPTALRLVHDNPLGDAPTRSELIREWVRKARDLGMGPIPDDENFLLKKLSMQSPHKVRQLLSEYTTVWLREMSDTDIPVHQRDTKGRRAANVWLRNRFQD